MKGSKGQGEPVGWKDGPYKKGGGGQGDATARSSQVVNENERDGCYGTGFLSPAVKDPLATEGGYKR